MKAALFTNCFAYRLPPEEAAKWKFSEKMVRYIADLGYDAIELSAKRHLDLDRVLRGGAGHVRRLVEKHDLFISSLASHYNHLDPNLTKRSQFNRRFKKVIETAQALDVPNAITFSGIQIPFSYFYPHPESLLDEVEKAWGEFGQVMGGLTDFADEHDVRIAVEPHHGFLAYNTQTTKRMFKEVPSRSLGLNFDPSHLAWQFIDPVQVVREFPDRIYNVHAKDVEIRRPLLRKNGILCTGRWDSPERSWRFRIPGVGIIKWPRLIAALRRARYDYVLSFEHEDPVLGMEEGARAALKFLRRYTGKSART